MKLSSILKICAASVAIMCLAGCEWGAGDDADSWSDEYNWVNFSGVYKSGRQIYNVFQSGQNLTITDGRSATVYTGKFKSIRSATGYENTQAVTAPGSKDGVKTVDAEGKKPHTMPWAGDTIIGYFEASGNGGRIVGTFQGTVYDVNSDGWGEVFGNRTMTGTLITSKSVDINATCTANVEIGEGTGGGAAE